MKGKIQTGLMIALLVAGAAMAPFISFEIRQASAQNSLPAFPTASAVRFDAGVINGCSGDATLANGVLTVQNDCINGFNAKKCFALANGSSATTYAGVGIGCSPTSTLTVTATATSTATTATYGGTTISTATATSTATTAAHGAVALTASTLSASPVVGWFALH